MKKISKWLDEYIPVYLRDSTTVMVMVVDLDGVVRYVNDTYIKNFGFSKEEVLGKNYNGQIYHGDEEYVFSAAYNCLNTPGRIEKLIIRKPKAGESTFYFSEWEFSAFMDESNTSIGVLSIGVLISDTNPLKPYEKDSYFDLIDNMTSEAWAFYDKNLRLRVCNQKAIEIAKNVFNIEPVRGDSAFLYMEDQHKEQMAQAYKAALEGNTIQLELKTKNNLYFVVTLKPIFDASNQVLGVGHYCLEVTNVRKSLEENRKLSKRYQTLVSQVNGIVSILDLSGKILYISDTFSKFSGFRNDQILNKNYTEFIHPDDLNKLSNEMSSLRNANDSVVSVFRSAKSDGSYCWSLGRGTVLEEGGEKFILALILNIDELKKKDEIIEQHHMRFQQIAWLQSHEVRAPLARILALVDVIEEGIVEPDQLNDFLQHIKDASHELDNVIKRVVQMTEVQRPD
ncbi:MAG: PAS domain S-box protein [Thermaurantimonas sp.]